MRGRHLPSQGAQLSDISVMKHFLELPEAEPSQEGRGYLRASERPVTRGKEAKTWGEGVQTPGGSHSLEGDGEMGDPPCS